MSMALDRDELMSRRIDGQRLVYSDGETLLYNLSIGMGRDPALEAERAFVFEHPVLHPVPTFAAVAGGSTATMLEDLPIDWGRVVHGEQRLTVHRPLPAAGAFTMSKWVFETLDKGAEKGALITVRTEAALDSGEPVFAADSVMFARGNGGIGGPSRSSIEPHALPSRAPEIVHATETRIDQALLYRLNGDRNPLHADPDFARRAGFPAPILHGLCTYGIACRAVLASVCEYDPAGIAAFDVRFSAPVYPGETILTEIWVDRPTVSFRCRVAQRDAVVINNGRCLLA
jgi:acyl dehydratase